MSLKVTKNHICIEIVLRFLLFPFFEHNVIRNKSKACRYCLKIINDKKIINIPTYTFIIILYYCIKYIDIINIVVNV